MPRTNPGQGLCAILTSAWLMPCSAASISAPPPVTPVSRVSELPLHIRDGRVDADLSQVALGTITANLQNWGVLRVVFVDPELAREPVSLSIRAGSLEDAIKSLLSGFSYAMGRSGSRLEVVVLSTPPWRDGNRDTPSRNCGHASDHAASGTRTAYPLVPQTLDEFRPYDALEVECRDGSGGLGAAPTDDETRIQEHAIQRALDVLESPYTHLYADAIEQLGMYRDERGSAALIKLATQTPPRPERYLATEALARIAEQSEFTDTSAVMALEHLAAEGDAETRRLAGPLAERSHGVAAQRAPMADVIQE